jgi:hypothetical protein
MATCPRTGEPVRGSIGPPGLGAVVTVVDGTVVLVEVVLVEEVLLVEEVVAVDGTVLLVDELVVLDGTVVVLVPVAGTVVVVLDDVVLVEVVVVVGATVVVVVGATVVVVVGATVVVTAGAHSGLVTVFVSKVTAPLRASNRPCTTALVLAVMEVNARREPTKVEPTPSVAELPTCQKMLQSWAPLMMATLLLGAVMSVDAAWKMNTAFGSPWASSVSVPVISNASAR